jgi:excisionase family DNA binding protein
MPKEFYTPEQLAELLQVSKPAIYKWAQEGRIEVVRIGRTVRIPVGEVDRLLSEGRSSRTSERPPVMEQPVNKYRPATISSLRPPLVAGRVIKTKAL